MVITTTDTALLRLLQLASPALPVGAYAFSQGLEYAIEARWIKDVEAVKEWLTLQLQHGVAQVDLPLLRNLHAAWSEQDQQATIYWNASVLACRETAEFRLAETATGEALARLLPAFGIKIPAWIKPPTFVAMFALAASHWQLSPQVTAYAFVWGWLENQVMAATKLLPLGQTQAQVLLSELQGLLPALIETAMQSSEREPGAGLPGLVLASCKHETQYSRLFRS